MNKEDILDLLDDWDNSYELRLRTAQVSMEIKPNKWSRARFNKVYRLKVIVDWLRAKIESNELKIDAG